MPRNHPAYPAEFKAEAVRLATAPGNTLTGVARDLGVSSRACASGSARPTSTPADVTADQ